LALAAAALLIRALRFGVVFAGPNVSFPHGADEMYHLRRIWFSVIEFPATLSFDTYVNFPHGAPPVWPPLFDWSIAAVARALGGVDRAAVEAVAAWAPPILGVATVLLAAAIARRVFSPAAGWATGGLLAVLRAHVFFSGLGEVDHHVAVALSVLAALAAAMQVAGPADARDRHRRAITCGVSLAAALLLWPGALLYVATLQAALALQLLATAEAAAARARAGSLVWLHAGACLVLLPFCVGHTWEQFGAVSPLVLSGFQPLWFAAGAAAIASARGFWSLPALGATRARRCGSAFALVALGLVAALALVPGLVASLANAATWFGEDAFLGAVAEIEPLLFAEGRFDPQLAHAHFSYLFWAYPIAAAALALRALRERRGDVALLVFVCTVAVGLALLQRRFSDVAGPAFALVLGPALASLVRAARVGEPRRRSAAAAAGAACAFAVAIPFAGHYLVDVQASLAVRRGERLQFLPSVRQRIVHERVARWLAGHTPDPGGYLDPSVQPEYGVLAAWGYGHLLRYYAERPLVQDNFGPYAGGEGFAAARAYFASVDEAAGAEIARSLAARYVVAAPQGSGQSWPEPGSLATRLRVQFGAPLAALQRHRLLFVADDSDLAREPGRRPWSLAVYEVVAGALVRGRAAPGASVEFALRLDLGRGAPRLYRATVLAGPSGEYEVRLPHPSTAWVVTSGGRRAGLVVGEVDVREGRRVAGPSLGR
jgi:dolichyl-diphosphooligosaccharide--protein glycosyltransferase